MVVAETQKGSPGWLVEPRLSEAAQARHWPTVAGKGASMERPGLGAGAVGTQEPRNRH